MKSCCLVVIGHVDHGKTALVRALTGTDTDQLPEEKARGLSIKPGFAHCSSPSGVLDLVDAPGHADFVQGMVSGATGAQAALIVISGAEGVRAQTLEHLTIAELLGITNAVIAVTKSDLVPNRAAAQASIRAALSQTSFADAPMIACSALTGDGIDAVHGALETLLHLKGTRPPARQCFLPIDRAFTLPGRGTIVTGTLLGQPLTPDTAVQLQPAGRALSIRALQSRGETRDLITPGERVAVNLRGISPNEIPRGAVLCAQGSAAPATCVDAFVRLLPGQSKALKHMQKLRVLFGTTHEVAELRLLEREGDGAGYVQLRFKEPIVAFAGQAAVLRALSPPRTLGGATLLDPRATPTRARDVHRVPLLHAARQQDAPALALALSAAGGGIARRSDLDRLLHQPPTGTQSGTQSGTQLGAHFHPLTPDHMAPRSAIKQAIKQLKDALATAHLAHPLAAFAPRAVIDKLPFAPMLLDHVTDLLEARGGLRRQGDSVALWDHDPMALLDPEQRRILTLIEHTCHQSGLVPVPMDLPPLRGHAEILRLLIDTKALVSLRNVALKQDLLFHAENLASAARTLGSTFPCPQSFSVSQAREALHTSRRVIVPVLEYLDSIGVTIRTLNTRQMAHANVVPPPGLAC